MAGTRSQMEQAKEQLKEKDVQAIGQHCDLPSCHRLDFLPFVCESCKGTFCLDHRTETSHKCPKEGLWAAQRRAQEKSASPSPVPGHRLGGSGRPSTCAEPKCKTAINTTREPAVSCTVCKKQYCLAHRLQESHDCKPPPQPAAVVAQDKAKAALDRFRKWTVGKSDGLAKSMPQRRNTGVAEVMKMKREAKGDAKVPVEKRVYLYTEAEARTTTAKIPKGVFWYSKEWSVGRVLDVAAKSLQVQNVNNQSDSEEKKLRVFHVEGGRVLSFAEKIGDCTVNGNTVVLLRGLQMPDLLTE